jgi:hypothetical protein
MPKTDDTVLTLRIVDSEGNLLFNRTIPDPFIDWDGWNKLCDVAEQCAAEYYDDLKRGRVQPCA